jgi:hypothetical protein
MIHVNCPLRLKKKQIEEMELCVKNLKLFKSIFTSSMYRRFVAKTTELWRVGNRPLFVPSVVKTPSAAFRDLKVFPDGRLTHLN